MAALDVVLACSIDLADSLKDCIGIEYEKLLKDETFLEALTQSTSDSSVVKKRFLSVFSAFKS